MKSRTRSRAGSAARGTAEPTSSASPTATPANATRRFMSVSSRRTTTAPTARQASRLAAKTRSATPPLGSTMTHGEIGTERTCLDELVDEQHRAEKQGAEDDPVRAVGGRRPDACGGSAEAGTRHREQAEVADDRRRGDGPPLVPEARAG